MKSREQLERIVQKILAEAEQAEMPLSSCSLVINRSLGT